MPEQQESTAVLVTSENRAEFMAHRMGQSEPVEDAEIIEPVEAETKEPEAQEQEERVEEGEKKPNSAIERRFSELTRQREEARQEVARERAAREALEARFAALEGKGKPVVEEVKKTDEKPDPADFTDAFEYAEKLAEWASEQAIARRDSEEKEKAAKAEQAKTVSAWVERQSAVKADIPDYDEKIASSSVQVSDQVRDAILESEVGPRILYHLAENPDIASDIAEMTVPAALRAIGRIEAKFYPSSSAEKTENKPAVSKAPAPISPIKSGNAGAEVQIDANGEFKGSFSAYKAARKAGKIK